MAIDTGLLVGCTDLQAVGGIRQILITDLDNIDTVTAGSAGTNAYSSIVADTGSPWARFEFKMCFLLLLL